MTAACEREASAERRHARSEGRARLEAQGFGRLLDEDPSTVPNLLLEGDDQASSPTLGVLSDSPPPWAVAALTQEAFGPGRCVAPAWDLIPREPFETIPDGESLEALRGKGAAQ